MEEHTPVMGWPTNDQPPDFDRFILIFGEKK
jgi:hypothetical protein